MLRSLKIKNFKSILDDEIALGRVNVFIGENGCGKSNILEALSLASVAETYETVDADILYAHGMRVSKPSLMLSSFEGKRQKDTIELDLEFTDFSISCHLAAADKNSIYAQWQKIDKDDNGLHDAIQQAISAFVEQNQGISSHYSEVAAKQRALKALVAQQTKELQAITQQKMADAEEKKRQMKESKDYQSLKYFITYLLNTEALRGIPEFQISRKGIYGENLDVLISRLNKEEMEELHEYLYTVNWLQELFIDQKDKYKHDGYKLNHSKSLLYFRDRYMQKQNNIFSSENSNEGILHVLFYLTLLISRDVHPLFAIDNIETALNPHLCRHLMEVICQLAKKHKKQLLITTHNPAILDGLNLHDEEIYLYEVKRLDNGSTKTRRIAMKPEVDQAQYKLSELWTRGYLGAISPNF